MRDPRYWQPGHPERQAFSDWVTEGWQVLTRAGEGLGGTRQVTVRAYHRNRLGQDEQVDGYVQTRQARQDKSRRDRARATPAPAPSSAPVPPTFVAFIGGAGDSETRIVQDFRDAQTRALGSRASDYFTHDERGRILSSIAAQPAGTRIVLVGHSWGGDTAAQVAAALGAQGRLVDTLVTVDPVGRGLSEGFMRRVRAGSREWINIRATGGNWFDPSNIVAALGSPYGRLPERFATQHIEASFAHANFSSLIQAMNNQGSSGWLSVIGP